MSKMPDEAVEAIMTEKSARLTGPASVLHVSSPTTAKHITT